MTHRLPTRLVLSLLLLPVATLAGRAQSLLSSSDAAAPSSYSSSLVGTLDSSDNSAAAGVIRSKTVTSSPSGRFSRVGVGVKVGILGAGIEAATPLTRTLNLRGGFNSFSYADTFTVDQVNYDASLNFRSAEASLDWFPWARGFHLSPGALVYNGNQLSANASVPAGTDFTLNHDSYTSSATDPVTGTAKLDFRKFAPKLTAGFGNLLPRSGGHWSVPFELGFAYMGDPKVALNLSGTACPTTYPPSPCQNVATSQQIQSDIAAQEAKFQKDTEVARIFPIFSLGVAFNFGANGNR